jgi:hypothetical protein
MQSVPRRSLPEAQRELLAAFGRFLRANSEAILPASSQISRGPAAFLLYAIFIRLVQLGRALQELCVEGHAGDAQVLSGAMISAALDILLICEDEPDRRALLFALFQKRVRVRRSSAMVRHGHLTQQRADQLEAEQEAIDRQSLAGHAAGGTVPAEPLGNSTLNWSGLSDSAVARRLGRDRWYDLYYSPFSDAAHVNAAAIDKEIAQLVRGEVWIGGRFDSPWLVAMAAWEALGTVASALDAYFGLGANKALAEASSVMKTELHVYARRERETQEN